jgi:hypothetical protein
MREALLEDLLYRKFDNTKVFAALLGVPQVILGLLIEPTLSRGTERYGQANGHLGTDSRPPVQNSRQRLSADAQRLRGLGDTHIEWVQAQALDDFPGMGRIVHTHGETTSLVIILIINGVCVLSDKPKRNPPVSADRYGPGAFAVTLERMEVQAW